MKCDRLCNACGLQWAKKRPKLSDTAEISEKLFNTTISPKTSSRGMNVSKKLSNSILLRQRKEYLHRGLYSIENRIENSNTPRPFSITLPIHLGEFLLSKVRDFELPCDIHQERELGLVKGLMVNRQPFFTKIRSNIFVERKPQLKPDEQAVCHCTPPNNIDESGCGEDCINRQGITSLLKMH